MYALSKLITLQGWLRCGKIMSSQTPSSWVRLAAECGKERIEMATPLLITKLYIPPVRPELVSRPRLIERLNTGLHRKLTLVSAPAGFGKTTLLSKWAAGCGRSVAWVSLDKGDNDPARFWAYFVAALQALQADAAEPAVGEAALAMLQSPGVAGATSAGRLVAVARSPRWLYSSIFVF